VLVRARAECAQCVADSAHADAVAETDAAALTQTNAGAANASTVACANTNADTCADTCVREVLRAVGGL
jgi:hypothetical protein